MDNARIGSPISRRRFISTLSGLLAVSIPSPSIAMGQSGAFSARRMLTSRGRARSERDSGLSQWSRELVRRTSAPANLEAVHVAADSPRLLDAPFVIWSEEADPGALTPSERRGLEVFLRLGGMVIVDDAAPKSGDFSAAAKRELRRILPESPAVALAPSSVLYKAFYLVKRPIGRVLGPSQIEVITRGRLPRVLFLACDLLGALATNEDGSYRFELDSQSPRQRELAIRFAVNIAMFVLCSDYKDDQVHAEWIMRRRAGAPK